jgi:hypothetical protein
MWLNVTMHNEFRVEIMESKQGLVKFALMGNKSTY